MGVKEGVWWVVGCGLFHNLIVYAIVVGKNNSYLLRLLAKLLLLHSSDCSVYSVPSVQIHVLIGSVVGCIEINIKLYLKQEASAF